jgi:transglutaminase-like putative cysteine protease
VSNRRIFEQRATRRFGFALAAAAFAGWCALAAAPAVTPTPAEDEFRVFEADLGPAWIDVSSYPPEQQQSYALFSQRCSKCHTLARPINSVMKSEEWNTYVQRMSRKSGSNISPKDAGVILGFLVFDSKRRARTAGAVDPEIQPFLAVSRELSGVPRFPASKQDIRAENGTLRVTVSGDPRLDLSRFLVNDESQKLVRWTRQRPNQGELLLRAAPAAGGAPPAAAATPPDPAVRKAAVEAVDGAADAKEKVERILDWLDEEMKKQYRQGTAAAPALAADPRGDATEFTRMFVAMAQASGLPARTRVGLAPRRTGFFLHAWAEVWIGGWIPVDPYLGQFPAEVGHIRLAVGGADALAGWDPRRVPGLDRLELRVVLPESQAKAGS